MTDETLKLCCTDGDCPLCKMEKRILESYQTIKDREEMLDKYVDFEDKINREILKRDAAIKELMDVARECLNIFRSNFPLEYSQFIRPKLMEALFHAKGLLK